MKEKIPFFNLFTNTFSLPSKCPYCGSTEYIVTLTITKTCKYKIEISKNRIIRKNEDENDVDVVIEEVICKKCRNEIDIIP